VNLPIPHPYAAFEYAAHNTLLLPNLTFVQSAVGIKACQLCAGPGAAGRAIVGLARAQDKILAIDTGEPRGAKYFDMVDLLPVCASDAVRTQGLAYGPGKYRQEFDIAQAYFLTGIVNKKKPVSSPGNPAL